MKKVLSVFFLAVVALFVSFGVKAAGTGTSDLIIHFHAWNNDYTNLGSWAWGDTAAGKSTYDGMDDFGVYFEYNDIAIGTSVGFIAVEWPTTEGPNWDNKLTGDINIDPSALVEGESVHVYVFEDGNNQYLVADPTQYNMLIVYYDPSNAYEETLGVHAWNSWSGYQTLNDDGEWINETIVGSWGSPDLVFMTVGKASDGSEVKAAMLTTATAPTSEETPSLLIYAGKNENKKTGDFSAYTALGDTPVMGEAGTAWVVSKGDAYTTGDNIYNNDPEAFFVEAFSFRLVAFNSSEFTGTYAPNPKAVIVKTSANLTNPYQEATNATEQEAAIAEVAGWFTLVEVTAVDGEGVPTTYGDEVAIERVDFAQSNVTIQDFVLVLSDANALDNTKMYEIQFDLGLTDETNKAASIMVAMDTEAPVIAFTSPTSIVGQAAEDRVIEIVQGSEWNQSWFPRYQATDNRDGDLTSFVYVPSGEYSTLDTRELGDYTIMLEVSDKWGNVTQMTFIFRVVEGDSK